MKALNDTGARMAVIVAGGFHASGLTEILKRGNINFAVVNPSFLNAEDTNFYKTIMMNEPMPLDRMFPLPTLELANRLSPQCQADKYAGKSDTRSAINERDRVAGKDINNCQII